MAASIRTYLREDLKVGGPVNANQRVQALMDEGLDNWNAFEDFKGEDVEDLVKYLRRNGGRNADGIQIPAIALKRLKVACYASKYYVMIGRAVGRESMAWTRINHFETLMQIEEEYKEPDALATPSSGGKFMEWIDSLESHLRELRGVRKVPLSYVIRDTVDPGVAPGYAAGYDLPYGDEYSSFQEEMIGRATHDHPTYSTDNEQVYHVIATALADTPYLSSIKRHRSNKDGRGAYLDLVLHHLGSNKWNSIASNSDKRSTTLTWNGRSHRYTLARHINSLRSCHNDLIRCNDHIEYAIPTETQRVERLLASIQSNDPSILSAVTTIKSSKDDRTGLYTDFERAADFLLTVAPKMAKGVRDHQISGVQQDYDSIEKPMNRGPRTGVELRYHTQSEYRNLSAEEKDELRELRPPRSGSGHNKRKKGESNVENKTDGQRVGNRPGRNQVRKYKRANKKLESRIAALEAVVTEEVAKEQYQRSPAKVNERGGLTSPIQRRS